MAFSRPFPALLAVTLLAAPALSQTFTVDQAGSGDFTSLDAAIQGVPSGAVLLVLPQAAPTAPPYEAAIITSKSVSIVGLGNAPVRASRAWVRDLAENQRVSFRNLRFRTTHSPFSSVDIDRCEGTVRFHGCEMIQSTVDSNTHLALVDIFESSNVSLDECEIHGGLSFRDGIALDDSRLIATRTTIQAGNVERGVAFTDVRDGRPGKAGVRIEGRSFAWLGSSLIQGGEGESIENGSSGMGWGRGGDGGAGLDVGPNSVCVRVSSHAVGGDPGRYYGWGGGSANSGDPGADISGDATSVPGGQRTLDAVAPTLDANQPLRLRAKGLPGEHVTLYGSSSVHFRFLGPLYGVFGIQFPARRLLFDAGVVPASGILEFDFDPQLPRGMTRDQFDLQALFRSGTNRFRLSNVESIIRL